jgi:cytochrome P450
MDLPPGPRAPAAWQTVGWMARPAAFLRRVHERFGDPATIRTYWTEEPMVLFSHPDAVREIFRLDPAIAPAGRSWEFLRPFAGAESILLLDGEEHLRERRLLQAPFHGERMQAFRPIVAELAERELGTWSGRVVTLERMRHLALEIILRVIFGAHGEDETSRLRAGVEDALAGVRSLPRVLAMALVRRDLGPRSPWGRFRVAVERFDELLLDVVARRRAEPAANGDCVLAMLLEQRDEQGRPPSDRHLRDELVALLVGGHDSSAASLAWAFERLARHPAVHARLSRWPPASGSRCAATTSGPRPARSGRSAGSRAGSRIRCRGSRSAAACAAAPARRSRRWRCERSCALRRTSRSGRSAPSPSARGGACSW